ncbi:MAG: hypothetical protein LBR07_05135 [Puniceicoccales bacterium]|jgi:hypothetical protein|nr:hypothetical protein [Puniceicoccales bacterium]
MSKRVGGWAERWRTSPVTVLPIVFSREPVGASLPAFLKPVLAQKNGQQAWSVTEGHVNNCFPKVGGVRMGEPTGKVSDWAVPISDAGLIYLRAEWGNGGPFPGGFEYDVIYAQPGTIEDTETQGHMLIGRIAPVQTGAGQQQRWKVIPYNAANWQVMVTGQTWVWVPRSLPIWTMAVQTDEAEAEAGAMPGESDAGFPPLMSAQ